MDALARQRCATYRFWREDVAGRRGGDWADVHGVQVHTTGLAARHWNGAHVTRSVALPDVLPRVADWFAQRGKPWALLVPAELGLEPTGLRHQSDQAVMVREVRSVDDGAPRSVPPGLDIRADATAAAVARVQSEAFGDPFDSTLAFVEPTLDPGARPPQATLTAYEGLEPVGCATVALLGQVAGIYGVAVRAEWRRRGVGAALTRRCLGRARAAGCDLAYLNPSPMGHGMYAALGFRDALPMRVWVPD